MICSPLSVHQEVIIPLSQGGVVSAEWPEKMAKNEVPPRLSHPSNITYMSIYVLPKRSGPGNRPALSKSPERSLYYITDISLSFIKYIVVLRLLNCVYFLYCRDN